MSSPVNELIFWKERIDAAKKNGKLHYSVYIANDVLWQNIFKIHKEILSREVKPTDKVLDAGCGYGRMSTLFSNGYTGVDFSYDFIHEAQKLYPNKKFVVADLTSLPFLNKHFDVGFCISIKAMIISNLGQEAWEPMEKELKRVCKKLLILEYGNADDKNYLSLAEKYEVIT